MLSLVVPLFNEAESLAALHAEIVRVAGDEGLDFELVFVDDGSTDASWATITRLADADSRVRAIRFRRNFGKAAALDAGFAMARGERIVTLDADLQDNPSEIPALLAALGEFDLVSGWKQVRHDPWHKVFPSRVFNALVSRATGVRLHDHNCGLKAYRREVVSELRLYGEMHRFIPVLAAARGFRVGERPVNHRPRQFGHSKYGARRFVKGLFDLATVWFLTNLGQRPLHLFGSLALAFGAATVLLAMVSAGLLLAVSGDSIGRTLLAAVAAIVLGGGALAVQLFAFGLVAELIVFRTTDERRGYAVAEFLNLPVEPTREVKPGAGDTISAIPRPLLRFKHEAAK